MVFTDIEPVIAAIRAMGKRRGQIFMDSAESEKLSAGFYFGNQLMSANHNFINNYFALLYVINGEGWFRDHEGTIHALHPGVMMIRHPGKTHSMERKSGDNWLEFACAVPTSLYLALVKAGIIQSNRYCLNPGLSMELIDKAGNYVECFKHPGGISQVYSSFIALHSSFVEAARQREDGDANPATDERIAKARKLLLDPAGGGDNLPELAARLGMGYESFRKRFKAETGFSPHQYRILHTLDKADAMLRQTDMLVKEIALSLGYTDTADFIRQYRKFRHTSPASHRKALTGKSGALSPSD